MSEDILKVAGINSKGYGSISKLAMTDGRLTIEAKGIYSYFCSFAGSGRQAFPKITKILSELGISKGRYYKHFKLLTDNGYIQVDQIHRGGRFSHNVYTLSADIPMPENAMPHPKPLEDKSVLLFPQNRDTVDSDACLQPDDQQAQMPYAQLQDTQKQCPQNKDTVFEDSNNNSISKSFDKHILSSPSSLIDNLSHANKTGQGRTDETRPDNQLNIRIIELENVIKKNIDYLSFIRLHYPRIRLVDELVEIMIDTLISDEPYAWIGGGGKDGREKARKPMELVKRRLMQINSADIEHVIDRFSEQTQKITFKKQYLLTMLYNSKLEAEAHYTNAYSSGEL